MLKIDDITIAYKNVPTVMDFSLNMAPGQIVSLVGESGSGKTTVIRAILGLLAGGGKVTKGDILFHGTSLLKNTPEQWRKLRGSEISMIFQDSGAMMNPTRKIGSVFTEYLQTHEKISKKDAIIDSVSSYIDQRVRVSAFKAEQTLTKDTVPVNVDAVVYWTVWDVEKAALEVQQYQTAIEHIAQTGLRDTIGKHELSELLQERDKIAEDLQQVLDRNTNPWGITCQTVGIKDIAIPKDLAEAMSKEAQAERERRARVILGTAETEIAEKFAQASRKYTDNPVALHLRGMNMLFEGLKEKGSMVIVPSSALDTMNLGAMGGLVSLAKNSEMPQKPVAATVPQV